MDADETTAFELEITRANNAELTLGIVRALSSHAWASPTAAADAEAHLASLASRDDNGALRFADGTDRFHATAADAAAALAASRPHWLASASPAAAAPRGVPATAARKQPVSTTMSYAQLLDPKNASQLREMLAKRSDELARLRDAHFPS